MGEDSALVSALLDDPAAEDSLPLVSLEADLSLAAALLDDLSLSVLSLPLLSSFCLGRP